MRLLLVAFTALALSVGTAAVAAPPPHGKIVLVAQSGAEDMMKLGAPYHHAVLMKKTGRLEEVAIVVYGRAVSAVSTQVKAIPDALRAAVKAAHDAGVHIYVCETALEKAGLSKDALMPPGVEPVPQGAAKIAELVSQGYVPMQY